MGQRVKMVAMVVTLLSLLPGVFHALAADQKILVGLKGVHVLEDIDPQSVRLGLTKDQIKTDVELRLRKAGVRVLRDKEWMAMPGQPSLIVIVTSFVRTDAPLAAVSICVGLVEEVTLDRGFKTPGMIWEERNVGTVGTSNIRELRGIVGDLVDKFINDYLAANPKK